ncbi:MAG: hypothetical protein K2J02_03315, partial [Malacoplasma sp.]|nr:hypothetical protein [Malacoplasma sp.]
MKITYQNNSNDCGVCVLSSIYEFLYKEKITDESILNEFKIGKNGISIYDLEILAKDINIDLESYDVDFHQLLSLNYKDYFVTLFKSEVGNHFVICKMKKTFIEVYDSVKGLIKLNFEEFEKIYNNIFIVFSKSTFKKEINSGVEIVRKIKFFDLPNESLFCSLIVFLDLIILSVSLIGSGLVKLAIGLVGNNTSQNLFFIGLYFIIVFLLEALMHYLVSLVKIKKIDELTKRNIIFYINYLNNKNFLFFSEKNKKELYQYPT